MHDFILDDVFSTLALLDEDFDETGSVIDICCVAADDEEEMQLE